MKKLVAGILAHVDAGKTTLSEGLLYTAGAIRRLGRVDHQDAFLDTNVLERQRGITIFSKQAVLSWEACTITLLDTPGHVDFSAEMERTLQVLDCAVLVISGTDGVQPHTQTLWQLLERRHIPTFLFINKMDLPGTDRAALLASLRARLDEGCMDFGGSKENLWEEAATASEEALTEYLDTGALTDATLRGLIAGRAVFPCWFGSALRLEGVEDLLRGLGRFAPQPTYPNQFGARVFKIGREGSARLTYMKITGGILRVKDAFSGTDHGEKWEEKAEQIRIYSGVRFQAVEAADAGTVCAVAGLSHTHAGQGFGFEEEAAPPALEPVLDYRLLLPPEADPHVVLDKLRPLAEEDPMLHLFWSERMQEIRLRLMGQVQLEVLRQVIAERFGLAVDFSPGSIVYKETIAAPVEGVGHYEPLRHYAEVHLLLEPGEPGSGLQFASACGEDQLDRNWQRLILTHLAEKQHVGVLIGAPITDMRITLTAGRAHIRHTEGGDFRQATYRAVRQGLMGAENVLLEPWYDFRLELPPETVGRAMGDIQNMGGQFDAPQPMGDFTRLTGNAPASEMGSYWKDVTAYTRGQGRLRCTLRGYAPCHNAKEVIAAAAYDPERDLDNPPDSVFCSHGAGVTVKWDRVPACAHVSSGIRILAPSSDPVSDPYSDSDPDIRTESSMKSELKGASARPFVSPPMSKKEEEVLQSIFERTYGPVKPRALQPTPKNLLSTPRVTVTPQLTGPEYLLIDGYNIIFAWDELKEIAKVNLEAARRMLMDLLCNYQGYKKCVVILVFDAYKVKGNPGSVEHWHNIHVVYTKEAETADTYIERATYAIARNHRVRVATSDNMEQLIILGHGAVRVSALEFHEEMEAVEGHIAEIIERNNRNGRELRQLRHHLKPPSGDATDKT